MINKKIKNLLKDNNKLLKDYAEAIGCTYGSVRHKVRNESFFIEDLIAAGKLSNTRLAFVDEEGNVITWFTEIDSKDFPEEERENIRNREFEEFRAIAGEMNDIEDLKNRFLSYAYKKGYIIHYTHIDLYVYSKKGNIKIELIDN